MSSATATRSALVANLTSTVKQFFTLQQTKPAAVQSEQMKIRRKALTFANQLNRHNPDLDMSDCFSYAWHEMKTNGDAYRFVKFVKVNGEVACRVIMAGHWSEYYTPKGNGRPLKEGQVGMIDAARLHTGNGRTFISTYLSRIVEIF